MIRTILYESKKRYEPSHWIGEVQNRTIHEPYRTIRFDSWIKPLNGFRSGFNWVFKIIIRSYKKIWGLCDALTQLIPNSTLLLSSIKKIGEKIFDNQILDKKTSNLWSKSIKIYLFLNLKFPFSRSKNPKFGFFLQIFFLTFSSASSALNTTSVTLVQDLWRVSKL